MRRDCLTWNESNLEEMKRSSPVLFTVPSQSSDDDHCNPGDCRTRLRGREAPRWLLEIVVVNDPLS